MKNKPDIIKKHDIILIVVLLITAAVLAGGYSLTHRSPGLYAEVSVGGKEVATLDLDKDQEVTVFGYNGGQNHLTVKDGQICCDHATCPDKVCVEMGRQYLEGAMIVCLPNSMIVQIKAEK